MRHRSHTFVLGRFNNTLSDHYCLASLGKEKPSKETRVSFSRMETQTIHLATAQNIPLHLGLIFQHKKDCNLKAYTLHLNLD